MATPPFPITLVRWPESDAGTILQQFVFGGRYSGARAPRGIDPEYVSWWIREKVPLDADPIAVMHLRDLLRFYERVDALAHISRMLTRAEANERDLRRSAYALQCVGEIGTPEQVRFGAGYFHEFIVPHPIAITYFPLLLESAESLAGAVDMGALGRRLQREIAAAAPKPGENESVQYLKYTDWNRMQLPVSVRIVETKQRLLAADPAGSLQELLVIYLGESLASTPSMIIWAGRMLRQIAQRPEGAAPVINAFSQVMDAAHRSQMAQAKKELIVHRCGQAILYLGGKLTFAQREVFDSLKSGQANFLWDDPGAPSYPMQ